MNIYYDKDANLELLRDKHIAVIGYGSQGFAQANNLKDSGCNVTVGLRTGSSSREKAENAGLKVAPVAQAAAEADLVMMLVPDELAPGIYAREIAESITPGKYLAFSHGFSIHYKFIEPATRRERLHGRSERSRSSRASRVQTRRGRALPARR